MVSIYNTQMKADRMFAENISALLRARHQNQKDLCDWCGRSAVWLSKILTTERAVQIKDFDRIADFFGLATYQLFQPGISKLTDRRGGVDRRTGGDRRIGHSQRLLGDLADTIDAARPGQRGRAHESVPEEHPALRTLLDDMQRRFKVLLAQTAAKANPRRQDSRARKAVAAARPGAGSPRGRAARKS